MLSRVCLVGREEGDVEYKQRLWNLSRYVVSRAFEALRLRPSCRQSGDDGTWGDALFSEKTEMPALSPVERVSGFCRPERPKLILQRKNPKNGFGCVRKCTAFSIAVGECFSKNARKDSGGRGFGTFRKALLRNRGLTPWVASSES